MPATTLCPLTSAHPKIEQFLRLWHENGRAQSQRSRPSHNYDKKRKTARDRRLYLLLNSGNAGVFLVQRSTQYVYQLDDYGSWMAPAPAVFLLCLVVVCLFP